MAARPLRSLYICYLSLDDPLVHTQVVAYLAGLAEAGHEIHLLTFETARLNFESRQKWTATMSRHGIRWHGLQYHKQPSLPATVYDTFAGAVVASRLIRRHDVEVIHARSHVPAAMALIARRLARRQTRLIFDLRGLMAEEYVDAGRWAEGGIPYRLTKAVERAGLRVADGVVVLTERVREQLFGGRPRLGVFVIPCCADLGAIEAAAPEREAMRAQLGIGAEPVLVYVGKFGGWYMQREMAEFFVVAGEVLPGLRFLIVTQGDAEEIEPELRAAGAATGEFVVTSAPPERMGAYLATADCAVSFIRPSPSKASSSPTKIGEYLAAGLPIASTTGVGDLDRQLGPDVAALVSSHTAADHQRAAEQLGALMADSATGERCRALARQHYSLAEVGIPRYRTLYEYVSQLRSGVP